MSISPGIAGVVLAAGASTRMGRDKALLPWKGSTLLGVTIDRIKRATELVIVVAGTNSESLKVEVFSRAAYLVINPNPEEGQFSSLRIGLQAVMNHGRDSALIALVDRPPAAAVTLEQMIARFRENGRETGKYKKWAVVPESIDPATGIAKHGHPILVGREMIEAFLKADPTSNARDVEHTYQARIDYLPVNDPNILANVNTPEEFERLTSQ